MTFRKLLFWTHLILGVCAGAVVFIMSVTGVLLMYEKQMIAWADSGYRSQPGTTSIEAVLSRAREERQALPSSVTLSSVPDSAAALAYGRDSTIYVDAGSGARLGVASQSVRGFFHVVTDWHRWLAMEGTGRAAGRAITGGANLAFLFLVISGAYLWIPRAFGWQHFRAVSWFRPGLTGKARDFNWHNVIGLWSLAPLFLIVVSGTVISYPWAGDLVYKATGTEQQKATPGNRKQGPGGPPADLDLTGVDAAWQRAAAQVPGWNSITLRLPGSHRGPLTFTIDAGTPGQPQKRTTLTISRPDAEIQRTETFNALDAGRQWRTWLRFVHTGEYYGIAGQTVAGAASLGASFLVWTGIALSWRRWRAWKSRKT